MKSDTWKFPDYKHKLEFYKCQISLSTFRQWALETSPGRAGDINSKNKYLRAHKNVFSIQCISIF